MSAAPGNLLLRAIALSSIVLNITFSQVYRLLGVGEANEREISDRYMNLFVPAEYAFAIWGVIYAALAAYAIYALLPSQHREPMHDRIAPWLLAVNVLSIIWIAVFSQDWPVAAAAVLAMTVAWGIGYYKSANDGLAAGLRSFVRVPASLFVSWVSVALIGNVTMALVAEGVRPDSTAAAMVMLTIAFLLSTFMAFRFHDSVFPAVTAWASVALAVRNGGTTFAVYAIIVAVVSALTVAMVLARRLRQGRPSAGRRYALA